MAEYLIQDTTLDAIADAINAKTGGSSAMTPAEMVTAIGSISGGGGSQIVKKQYTQAEDWLSVSGTTGTFLGVANLYANDGAGIYFIVCTNNNAPTKTFSNGVIYRDTTVSLYASARSGATRGGALRESDSFDAFITAGATIDVSFIPKSEVVS